MNYNERYIFISKGDWFKKGTECLVEDGNSLWSTDNQEVTDQQIMFNPSKIQGIFVGIRICEDNPCENRLGYKAGDEREDGELCSLDEFEVIKKV